MKGGPRSVELSPLSRGTILLERICVCRWAFVSRVPCASTGLGWATVYFFDEKVAQQSVFVTR